MYIGPGQFIDQTSFKLDNTLPPRRGIDKTLAAKKVYLLGITTVTMQDLCGSEAKGD